MKNIDLGLYILDESGNPQKIYDHIEWRQWFRSANRSVAQTIIDNVLVSTAFLGMDFNTSDTEDSVPILYETIVFEDNIDQEVRRWRTKIEAIEGHNGIVKQIMAQK